MDHNISENTRGVVVPMHTPLDPRDVVRDDPTTGLVPQRLVVEAIKAAAKERVQAYRDAKDNGRLSARHYLRYVVSRYSIEEVQTWLDECRAERWG